LLGTESFLERKGGEMSFLRTDLHPVRHKSHSPHHIIGVKQHSYLREGSLLLGADGCLTRIGDALGSRRIVLGVGQRVSMLSAKTYVYRFLRIPEWLRPRRYWSSAQAMLDDCEGLEEKGRFKRLDEGRMALRRCQDFDETTMEYSICIRMAAESSTKRWTKQLYHIALLSINR
jgi:hypothetical protein